MSIKNRPCFPPFPHESYVLYYVFHHFVRLFPNRSSRSGFCSEVGKKVTVFRPVTIHFQSLSLEEARFLVDSLKLLLLAYCEKTSRFCLQFVIYCAVLHRGDVSVSIFGSSFCLIDTKEKRTGRFLPLFFCSPAERSRSVQSLKAISCCQS